MGYNGHIRTPVISCSKLDIYFLGLMAYVVSVRSHIVPKLAMLSLNASHSPVSIPLFLWETILNCTCLRLYSDGSHLSAAVIEEVVHHVPIVLYNETYQKSSSFHHCNILAVSENISYFKPPESLSFINILLTAERSNDTSLYTTQFERYNRKIFFWISGITTQPIIQSLDANGEIENLSENMFKGSIDMMYSKSLHLPDFRGKKIYISVANRTIYSLVGENGNETKWVSGVEYVVIDLICELLNLTKIIIPANEAGNLENGNATGIVADVINDRTDVGIGGIWLNSEMELAVEYIHPYDWRCGHYLVPRPSLAVKNSNLIFLPFEESLWVTVGAAIFLGSGMKTVFARFLDEGFGRRYESFKWSLYSSIMHLISRYYPNETENRGVMRPLFVSWSWLSVMLTSAYSGQLAAIFVNPRYEDKPQNIVEFHKKGYYWGGPTAGPPHTYQTLISPVYSPLWRNERFLREESVDDRNERMRKGTYVVRGESLDDYFFFDDDHMPTDDIVKNYEAAGECYAVFYTAPIFPRGSPYSELFNRVVSLLRETGIKKKQKKQLFSTKPIKNFILRNVFYFTESNKTKEFIPVNLSLVSSPFILLIAGHSISILIFLANHLFLRGKKSNLRVSKTNEKLIKVRRFPFND